MGCHGLGKSWSKWRHKYWLWLTGTMFFFIIACNYNQDVITPDNCFTRAREVKWKYCFGMMVRGDNFHTRIRITRSNCASDHLCTIVGEQLGRAVATTHSPGSADDLKILIWREHQARCDWNLDGWCGILFFNLNLVASSCSCIANALLVLC